MPPSLSRRKHFAPLQYESARRSALTKQISPGPLHEGHLPFVQAPLQHPTLPCALHVEPAARHEVQVSVPRSQPRLQHSLSKKHDCPFALHCSVHALALGLQ